MGQNQIKYNNNEKLGRGSYGTVYLGTFQGTDVAVKRIPLDQVEKREEDALRRLDHPNVVELFWTEEETDFK